MAGSVDRDGPRRPSDGRIFRLGPDWALCRFPLPTSMPIPLSATAPEGLDLATWAFAGMTAPAAAPVCLLLLRVRGDAAAALAAGTDLAVDTHYHPVAVATGPAEEPEGLTPEERAVMARAVLSSMTEATVAELAGPIALFAPALRSEAIPKTAPRIAIPDDRPAACTVTGLDVPNYLVFDGEAGYRCARVAHARLTLG